MFDAHLRHIGTYRFSDEQFYRASSIVWHGPWSSRTGKHSPVLYRALSFKRTTMIELNVSSCPLRFLYFSFHKNPNDTDEGPKLPPAKVMFALDQERAWGALPPWRSSTVSFHAGYGHFSLGPFGSMALSPTCALLTVRGPLAPDPGPVGFLANMNESI